MLPISEKDKIKINDLLNIIAEDEEFAEKVATALGEDPEEFVIWVNNTEV